MYDGRNNVLPPFFCSKAIPFPFRFLSPLSRIMTLPNILPPLDPIPLPPLSLLLSPDYVNGLFIRRLLFLFSFLVRPSPSVIRHPPSIPRQEHTTATVCPFHEKRGAATPPLPKRDRMKGGG